MKKFLILIAILLFIIKGSMAQFRYKAPNFDTTYIKPADLLVEATVTGISYFQDTSIKKIDYDYYNYDENGVWFVKYELTVHKIFKGNCDNKVILITPYYGGGTAIINNKEVVFKGRWIGYRSHGLGDPINFHIDNTGIFILNKNELTSGFPYLPKTYKFRNTHYNKFLGGFEYIGEMSYFGIRQADSLYKFNEIDELYNYLEGTTKQTRKDITHKQFEILSTYAKVQAYKEKHFADSMYSRTFNEKLRTGEINQLNKDNYIYNKTYLNKRNNTKVDSIKQDKSQSIKKS